MIKWLTRTCTAKQYVSNVIIYTMVLYNLKCCFSTNGINSKFSSLTLFHLPWKGCSQLTLGYLKIAFKTILERKCWRKLHVLKTVSTECKCKSNQKLYLKKYISWANKKFYFYQGCFWVRRISWLILAQVSVFPVVSNRFTTVYPADSVMSVR